MNLWSRSQLAGSVFRHTFNQARVQAKRSYFSAVFSSTWSSLGSFLGTYDAVDPRNKAMRGVIGTQASEPSLVASLPYIRNLCRNYERNNPTVRAGMEAIVALTVGSGIALEPDSGDPVWDALIRRGWVEYINDCTTTGQNIYALQSIGMRDAVIAGELLWRFVVDDARSAKGKIPLIIMPIQPEWLGQDGSYTPNNGNGTIGGIDLDTFGRPVSYNLQGPTGKYENVPVDSIIHWFERRRGLQVRGEPWFAPLLTTLRQVKDLVTAELEAAKNTASFSAFITTQGSTAPQMDEKQSPVRDLELGSIIEGAPGEGVQLLSHTRPSQQISPFRDMLNGDIAACLRIGKRWLNRDVSQANYSSMRADMLDQERLSVPVREDFGHGTIGKIYKKILPYLCLRAGVPMKSESYRLLPDGQPYVDPLKDVQAAAYAVAYGFSDFETEIGKRGSDYKKVWERLAAQRKEIEAADLHIKDPTGGMALEDPAESEAAGGGNSSHGSDRPRDKDGHFA